MNTPSDDYGYEYLCILDQILADGDSDAEYCWDNAGWLVSKFLAKF